MKLRPVKFAAPNLLQARLQRWRSRFMLGVLALLFLALGGRAIWLQAMQGHYLLAKGALQYEREVELPADRGNILDRNGAVLATSLPARSVWAFPERVDLSDPRVGDLARLLHYSRADLVARLSQGEDFVFLRRQVELDVAERIRALQIPGVGLDREYKRHYPEREATAHLVGFTGIEHQGQEGLELSFDLLLGGAPGKRRVFRDGGGQIIGGLEASVEPRDGHDLRLTIDTRIQFQAFQALKHAVEDNQAKAGAAIVLDARSGEVLALANWPSYDPNQVGRRGGDRIRNRAITDTFEPGSTSKPFTAAMALESGHYRPDSMIDVSAGKMTIGRRTIRDSTRHRKPLTLEQIIEKSSNIGTAKIALDLPSDDLFAMLSTAGFGQAPRIGFPGVAAGVLRPAAGWKPIEHATISYGHGFSVSLLQLARAYTAFANDGAVLPISLFRHGDRDDAGDATSDGEFGDGRIVKVAAAPSSTLSGRYAGTAAVAQRGTAAASAAQRGAAVMRPQTAHAINAMLELAVGPKGTAPAARVPGYRVGGKTGTSYKNEDGHYIKKYVSSFVGLAPMSDPKLIVAVMLDEPQVGKHLGGDVAAPVFSTIAHHALRTLRIAPDAPFGSRIVPPSVEPPALEQGDLLRADAGAVLPVARAVSARLSRAAGAAGPASGSVRAAGHAMTRPAAANRAMAGAAAAKRAEAGPAAASRAEAGGSAAADRAVARRQTAERDAQGAARPAPDLARPSAAKPLVTSQGAVRSVLPPSARAGPGGAA